MSHDSRAAHVKASIGTGADDGQIFTPTTNEGDNIRADIEAIQGSSGATDFVGTADAERFVGGPGPDTFLAGGGGDESSPRSSRGCTTSGAAPSA